MNPSQNCTGCFLIASPYLHDGNFFRSVVLIIRHSGEGAFGVIINRAGPQRFGEVIALSDPSWAKASSPKSKPGSDFDDLKLGQDATAGNKAGNKAENMAGESTGQSTSGGIHRDQIYLGGPVDGPMLALHDIAGIGEPCGVDIATGDGENPTGSETTLHDHPAEPWGSISIEWADVPAWVTADEDHLRLLARRDDAQLRFVVGYAGWGPNQLEAELNEGGWLVTPAEASSLFGPSDEVWEKLVHRCGQAILQDLTPDVSFPNEQQGFDPGVN